MNHSLFTALNPKWQSRINRGVDIVRMVSTLSREKEETIANKLMNSTYAHNPHRLAAFVCISVNLCFGWPNHIDQSVKIFQYFVDLQSKDNCFGETKKMLYSQLFHWYFNDITDDIYIFVLHFFLKCLQSGIFPQDEFVKKVKKRFLKKRNYTNQLCMMLIFFSPEIEISDKVFFNETQNFMQRCQVKHILSSKIEKIILSYDIYRNNDWSFLKENRIAPTDRLYKALATDDLNTFISCVQEIGGDFNGYLENSAFSLCQFFDTGFPYISAAAIFGSSIIFSYLHQLGISLNTRCKNGATLFQCACINPNSAIMNILVDSKLDQKSPMTSFARCFNLDVFSEYLPMALNDKCDLSPSGTLAINQSLLTCHYIVFKMCLEKSVDVNAIDSFGMNAFECACQVGNYMLMKVLSKLGADVTKGHPMMYAASFGHTLTMSSMLKNGKIDPDKLDDNVTPLKSAIINSHYGAVKLLLDDKRVDLKRRFRNGITYLNIAASQNDIRIMKLVIEKVKIDFSDLEISPLFNAILNDMPNMVEYLLSLKGINPECITKITDVSALWLAVKFKNYEIAEFLIKKSYQKVAVNEILLAQHNYDDKMVEMLTQFKCE